MKPPLLIALLCVALGGAQAQEPSEKAEPRKTAIPNWGTALDLARDCEFKAEDGKLTIVVPGSEKPHDIATELNSSTAPRVLQPAKGDFTLIVKVEGEFQPGGESTQPGRTGYNGAGLVVFADAKNYVRFERATLQRLNERSWAYTNFEFRVDGELERIGLTNDAPLDETKPTWLRLQRKGDELLGAVSQDGVTWNESKPKNFPGNAWKAQVLAGISASSTSKKVFSPVFSEFSLKSEWAPPK